MVAGSDNIDYSKLTPELRKKLADIDKNKPANKQVELLGDIATLLQANLDALDDNSKSDKEIKTQLGALSAAIQTSLDKIASKKDPEAADNSGVIDAVNALSSKLDEKEFTTTVEAPKVSVSAPVVNVDAPDLAGFKKLLKTELPILLKRALKELPEIEVNSPDYTPVFESMNELLGDIDMGVRIKPQAPSKEVHLMGWNVDTLAWLPVLVDTTGQLLGVGGGTTTPTSDGYLMESGDGLLLESGDRLLLE